MQPARAHTEYPLKEKVSKADVVALVQVRSKNFYPKVTDPVLRKRAILRVVTAYKGKVEGNEVTVAFGPTGSCPTCSFQVGDSWMVFLKRVKPGFYTPLNCHYGQMEPWESLVDKVRAMTGSSKMMGSPLRTGKPLILVASELSPSQWAGLQVKSLALGMNLNQVFKAAGAPDRKTMGGRWWLWKKAQVRAHFNEEGKVDLLTGTELRIGSAPLIKERDLPNAAASLGKPFATVGAWKLYQGSGLCVGVRFKENRLAGFCLAPDEARLRAYIKTVRPPAAKKPDSLAQTP